MNEIEDRWKTYRLKVIPLDAPDFQVVEMRRCYYAGAQAVVDMAMRSTAQGQIQAAREMRGFKDEIERFRADVRADRA